MAAGIRSGVRKLRYLRGEMTQEELATLFIALFWFLRLRELSRTSFVVTAGVVLLFIGPLVASGLALLRVRDRREAEESA